MNIFSKKLLLSNSIYKTNEILLEIKEGSSTYQPTLTSLDIKQKGVYLLELVSGGGGGAYAISVASTETDSTRRRNYADASGGSGAAFVGEVRLNKGLYTINCGEGGERSYATTFDGTTVTSTWSMLHKGTNGGETYIELNSVKLISLSGGTKASASAGYSYNVATATAGQGGTITVSNDIQIVNQIISSNGNNGTAATKRLTSGSTVPSIVQPSTASPYVLYDSSSIAGNGGGSRSQGNYGLVRITYLRRS